jgi:hypothetical protein
MPPRKRAGCPLAAACGRSASRRMRPAAAGMPSIPLWGRGKPGARRMPPAGGGEGEGGETMPDAEMSPPPPDEPPAENSIEG